MGPYTRGMMGVAVVIVVSGCRAATRVSDVPRVDLELSAMGNRGYLVGTPPEAPPRTSTRQMVEMDVEIPSLYTPTVSRTPIRLDELAPREEGEPSVLVEPVMSESTQMIYDTYTVKSGDSLSTIAAHPDIYGKASQWRRIFEANRDVLKHPDAIRVGMILKIPRTEATSRNTESSDVMYLK